MSVLPLPCFAGVIRKGLLARRYPRLDSSRSSLSCLAVLGTRFIAPELYLPPDAVHPNSRINPFAGRSGTWNLRPLSASAAAYPLRTAPSIVDGHPVAVQSPARNNRGHGLLCDGRNASLPGAGENVACTSLM